ncbi:redoxin family protein [uncultured Draconibacterium sp.]|uniref:redoxin family protein n=1 Tax=uncultured Draconibacterium sp. TaxID=1573823 RepID=UPI0025E3D5EE|nr:redoxin family protein [uncultured Draconibacterium sp.]
MKSKILLLSICLGIVFSACTQKEKICVIKGKVVNRPQSTQLMLSKPFEDDRAGEPVMIQIENSAFYYELAYTENEAYQLIFEDEYNHARWRPVTFFLDSDTIEFELYPMEEYKKNTVSGGEMNDEFLAHEKKESDALEEKLKSNTERIQTLMDNNEYESEKMKAVFDAIEKAETQEEKAKLYVEMARLNNSGEGLSEAAKKLNSERSSVVKIQKAKEFQYRKEHLSIPNYYSHIRDMKNSEYSHESYDQDELMAVQKIYAQKFKKHSYTTYSNEIAWRFENLKPGGVYFDCTLPDLNGEEHTLSEEIAGKYALIDIWAPWCGPCITKSRAMMPVYDEYSDKGFTVVGIVTKYVDTASVSERLDTDKYPWLSLLDKPEIDSRINEHYGTELEGGKTILVDNTGKVLALDPSADDVRDILEAKL